MVKFVVTPEIEKIIRQYNRNAVDNDSDVDPDVKAIDHLKLLHIAESLQTGDPTKGEKYFFCNFSKPRCSTSSQR